MTKREKTPPIFGRQYALTWRRATLGWEASWFPDDEKGARYLITGRGYVHASTTIWEVHLVLYHTDVRLFASSSRLPRAIAKLEKQFRDLEASVAQVRAC